MSASGSRRRVADAVAAALLAGAVAAWVTAPSDPGPLPGTGVTSAPLSAAVTAPPGERPSAAPPASATASDAVPSGQVTARLTARDARPSAGRAAPAAAPTRFESDRLDISMPVRSVGVARDGQMALPPSPADMGWYEYGPRPGEDTGATVLAAHRDMPDYGTGPAARLDRLRRGDVLTVRSGSTVRRYRVTQVARLEKEALDLEAIFDRTGPARLHVVTCGGRFDPATRSYEENLVVVGVPLG